MDKTTVHQVLATWFANCERNELGLDSRMNRWFETDAEFDQILTERFSELCNDAAKGKLDDWADHPHGRLALILLLDVFPRRIFGDSPAAYRGDRAALKLCEQGVAKDQYHKLTAIQQMFFFMPLQHAESLKVQRASVKVYGSLAKRVSKTLRVTFETVHQFAELRHDVIAEHGRFPHRDAPLGRDSKVDIPLISATDIEPELELA
jgi:uncharacterized protein (DUF924 family)